MRRAWSLAVLAAAVGLMTDETITYTYDVHGRLIRAVSVGTVNDDRDSAYAYDLADNRTEFDRSQPLNQAEAAPRRGDAPDHPSLGVRPDDTNRDPVGPGRAGATTGPAAALFDG